MHTNGIQMIEKMAQAHLARLRNVTQAKYIKWLNKNKNGELQEVLFL